MTSPRGNTGSLRFSLILNHPLLSKKGCHVERDGVVAGMWCNHYPLALRAVPLRQEITHKKLSFFAGPDAKGITSIRMSDKIPRFRGPGSPPVEEYGVERREVVRAHIIILNTLTTPAFGHPSNGGELRIRPRIVIAGPDPQ